MQRADSQRQISLSQFIGASGLKLYPAQTTEKAICLPVVQPAAERAVICGEEAFVPFAQSAGKIVLGRMRGYGEVEIDRAIAGGAGEPGRTGADIAGLS